MFWLHGIIVACRLYLVAETGDDSLVVVLGLLIAVAFLLQSSRSTGRASEVVVHGLSFPSACGIFLEQGWNSCPLH